MTNELTHAPQSRSGSTRDGLFQRHGWWWLDYYDAEGKRHRQKAAPDYDTAKKMYREKMTGIAKGDFLGIREEGITLKRFAEERYWPTIKGSLSFFEERRSRSILDQHILPRFGDCKLAKVRTEELDRWQSERMGEVSPGTVRKEMMRLKHLLNCAVKWKYIKDSPAKGLHTITMPPGRVRYLTPEEAGSCCSIKPVQSFACVSRWPYRPVHGGENSVAYAGLISICEPEPYPSLRPRMGRRGAFP